MEIFYDANKCAEILAVAREHREDLFFGNYELGKHFINEALRHAPSDVLARFEDVVIYRGARSNGLNHAMADAISKKESLASRVQAL